MREPRRKHRGTGRIWHRGGMRVTGVDACRGGWVAVSLDGRLRVQGARVHTSLAGVLDGDDASVVGIDMPLGLLESGWREAERTREWHTVRRMTIATTS